MNISDGLLDNFRIFPDKVALTFEGAETTYSELEALSAHAASILSEHRVKPGDRVALVVGNVPAFPVWYYGALRLGAIAVSVNTRLTGEEAAFILNDCEASVVIVPDGTDDEFTNDFPEIPILIVSDDGKSSDGKALNSGDRIDLGYLPSHGAERSGNDSLYFRNNRLSQGRDAFAPERAVDGSFLQSSLQDDSRGSAASHGAAVPLLRAEYSAQQRSQCRSDDHHAAGL